MRGFAPGDRVAYVTGDYEAYTGVGNLNAELPPLPRLDPMRNGRLR